MSTTTTSNSVQAIRKSLASRIRENIAAEARHAILVGSDLIEAMGTFTADELDEWKVWSANVTGKSYKTVQSYMAVARAHGSLTPSNASKVQGWTFEALQALASTPEEFRAKVVGKSGSMPTPETVRSVRDGIVPVDPEKQAAKQERQKQNEADKTVALASDLKPRIAALRRKSVDEAIVGAIALALDFNDRRNLLVPAVKLLYTNEKQG